METSSHSVIGLGNINVANGLNICVYIANRPPIESYVEQTYLAPMEKGEIANIAQYTGNHWRKVFNVYSKLMFTFFDIARKKTLVSNIEHPFVKASECETWQEYRDQYLLQAHSQTALLFSVPDVRAKNSLNIVMGKGYAEQLGYPNESPHTIDNEHNDFAIYEKQNLIVCPYFDYRQLSNIKIEALVGLMVSLIKKNKIGEQ